MHALLHKSTRLSLLSSNFCNLSFCWGLDKYYSANLIASEKIVLLFSISILNLGFGNNSMRFVYSMKRKIMKGVTSNVKKTDISQI